MTPGEILLRAYRPIVDESQEPRRAAVEPLVVTDAPIVRAIKCAANVACGGLALFFVYVLVVVL